MPKTPTRHFWPPSTSVALTVAVLLSLGGCNGDSNPDQDRAPGSSVEPGTPGAALPETDTPDPAELTITADDGQLLLRWEFDTSSVVRAGNDARVRLRLDNGAEVDEIGSLQWLEAGTPGVPSGETRLPVVAHQLDWQDTSLTAELVDTGGTSIARSAPMMIGDALAAGTDVIAPAVSRVGERFAQAVAFSADGSRLAIAQPADGEIRLLSARTASTSDLDANDGFTVDGLERADQLQIALAGFGATIAVWWQATDADRSTLAIIEPFGEGWYESARFTLPIMRSPVLDVSADGSAVSLATDDGRLERFRPIDDLWTHTSIAAIPDSIGARTIVADGSAVLVGDRGASLALQWFDVDGRPTDRSALPTGDIEPSTWRIGSSRLALDDQTLLLALTALVFDGAGLAIPTLWLFERDTSSDPWRQVETISRAASSSAVDLSLQQRGTPGAPAWLWRWNRASDAERAWATDAAIRDPDEGLVVLVRSPAVAAFGSAARTSLPEQPWRAAFELPRDGAAFSPGAPHVAAALTPTADRLAIGWPPPNASTATPDDQPVFPAGHLRLID